MSDVKKHLAIVVIDGMLMGFCHILSIKWDDQDSSSMNSFGTVRRFGPCSKWLWEPL